MVIEELRGWSVERTDNHLSSSSLKKLGLSLGSMKATDGHNTSSF
jgi:hypothetical protein